MNKIIASIRRISGFLVTSIVILFVGYFVFLRYFQSFLPLPVFIEAKRIYMNILAIGFFALIPISLVINYPIIIRTVLSMLVILSCCVFSYLSIDIPERILTSTEFNNHQYHITVEGDFDQNFVTYTVYKCDVDNFKCQELDSDYSSSIDSVALVVDEKTNEMHFVRNDDLIFAYGEQSREVLTSEQLGKYFYYVGVYPPYGSPSAEHAYSLYKCETSFAECQKLPFHYTDTGGSFKLTFDENTQEVTMYQWKYNTDDILIYSYGSEPKCYVERCSIVDN
jgi:hypothetical protein